MNLANYAGMEPREEMIGNHITPMVEQDHQSRINGQSSKLNAFRALMKPRFSKNKMDKTLDHVLIHHHLLLHHHQRRKRRKLMPELALRQKIKKLLMSLNKHQVHKISV